MLLPPSAITIFKSVLLRGKTLIIYKATNRLNGKMYIGQTVRPLEVRMAEHARHSNTPFDKAIQKYGIENFDVETIDTANSIEELNQKEIYWIEYYNTYGGNGYNACIGGENTTGFHHSEESKAKMSETKSRMYIGTNNPFYGKHHSAEIRKRFSECRKGRKLSDEWKRHVSENSAMKVKVKNVDTGEIFNSIVEACRKYDIEPTHISRVCRGKRKSCGGYHWEYVK